MQYTSMNLKYHEKVLEVLRCAETGTDDKVSRDGVEWLRYSNLITLFLFPEGSERGLFSC